MLKQIVDHLLSRFKKRIIHIEEIEGRSGDYYEIPSFIEGGIRERMERWGIKRLFSHQVKAIEAVLRGENVVIATGTASGKSLCYLIPTLWYLSKEPQSTFLYLFPTKALAQDQLKKLKELGLGSLSATYDGDTPMERRALVRERMRIILSNPDMLHLSILPNHTDWNNFFTHLKLVVVDEVHYYRGVFGSHMANILRRLRRIVSHYRANPVFIFCSATISNPAKYCQILLGLDVKAITEDGSPSPPKKFILWNPPLIGAYERRSSNIEAAEGILCLVEKGLRTIAFAKARKTAELIARYVKEAREDVAITPYRAGYTPQERRKIEKLLFNGELQAVVATRALELGIDIGFLDACVLVGYPGSIASTFQMAGRAGRKKEGLVILIAGEDALDQFLIRHPEHLFKTPPEEAICDPQNPYILKDHLACASFELPLEENLEIFGENAPALIEELFKEGKVAKLGNKWVWKAGGYPPRYVDIRSIGEEEYLIVDISKGGKVIGTEEGIRAFKTIHEGAIYLHQGESYLVSKFDLKERRAYVAPTEADYYTEAISTTEISVIEILEVSPLPQNPLFTKGFAKVEVAESVVAYRKKRLYTDEVLGVIPLDLPTVKFRTQALFLLIPSYMEGKLKEEGYDFAGALHALEHASIGILPLLAMCDRMDIGGVSTPFHPDTAHPTIFIYDAYSGGVGIARRGYERCEELLKFTQELIEGCPCEEGCPACVLSPKCGNNNQPMDKEGALYLLRLLLTPQ